MLYGQRQVGMPSRFVQDLPEQSSVMVGRARPSRRTIQRAAAEMRPASSWQDDISYEVPASAPAESEAANEDPDLGPEDFEDPSYEPDHGEGVSLYVGMGIRHKVHGLGELLGWSGSGSGMRLRLRFSDGAVRTIVASYCEPA